MKGSILFRYERRMGDLLSLSCARVRLVLRGSDSSFLLILGAILFMILFGCLLSKCFCTSAV